MLHTLTVSCNGESNRSALLRCWTVNGDRAGKMTGQRMRCFCNTVQHILWVTETAGIPSGSLPSGQETVSPPSRLQKAISPRVTISHEPPVQSKTHEHCKRKELDIHSRMSWSRFALSMYLLLLELRLHYNTQRWKKRERHIKKEDWVLCIVSLLFRSQW